MANRIGGDFDAETMEAFRAAYAAQLNTPEEMDLDDLTGLPSETVSNTSPWIEHTGLWKYPSGKGPEDNLREPFDPNQFITQQEDEDEFSPEEINQMIDEILEEDDEDEELTEEDIEAILQEVLQEEEVEDQFEADTYEDGETKGLTDEEVDALIDEILN